MSRLFGKLEVMRQRIGGSDWATAGAATTGAAITAPAADTRAVLRKLRRLIGFPRERGKMSARGSKELARNHGGGGAMKERSEAARIGVVIYDGVEPIDLGGTAGVVSIAKRILPGISSTLIAERTGPVRLA